VRIDTSSRLIITAGWIFSLLALIIGGIGVTNTMAMSVFERIREIGIMRAVGWTSTRIAALIVSEALGIGVIALAIGLFGGWGAAVLLTQSSSLSSLAHADFTGGVFAWGLAFALGVGLIGALYPAWRAISLTPIEALAGDADAPGRRPVEGADQVQQGALAAARRPGDGDELALPDAQRDVCERCDPDVLERARDAVDDDLGVAVSRAHVVLTQ
jgi:hypothetical protein